MNALEINKRIAELKLSDKFVFWPEYTEESINDSRKPANIRYKYRVDVDQKFIPIPNDPKTINWAENIAEAWELFEENPEVYVKKLQYVDKKIDYECVFRDSDLKVIGSAKADTAPLAICLAWIKVKESNNA